MSTTTVERVRRDPLGPSPEGATLTSTPSEQEPSPSLGRGIEKTKGKAKVCTPRVSRSKMPHQVVAKHSADEASTAGQTPESMSFVFDEQEMPSIIEMPTAIFEAADIGGDATYVAAPQDRGAVAKVRHGTGIEPLGRSKVEYRKVFASPKKVTTDDSVELTASDSSAPKRLVLKPTGALNVFLPNGIPRVIYVRQCPSGPTGGETPQRRISSLSRLLRTFRPRKDFLDDNDSECYRESLVAL